MRTGSLAIAIVAIAIAAFWLGRNSVSPAKAPAGETIAGPTGTTKVVFVPAQGAKAVEQPTTLAEIMQLPGDFAQTTALYLLLANADEAMLVRLLDESAELEPLSQREAATSILYQRFVDIDPSAAAAEVVKRGGPSIERFAATVFYSWARQDLNAAVARARELDPSLRMPAAVAILEARDDLPDDDRSAIAADLEVSDAFENLLTNEIVNRLAGDPAVAWDAIRQLPKSPIRMRQLGTVIAKWAQADPEAALAAASDFEEPELRSMLTQTACSVWAARDPDSAFAWALAQPDGNLRSQIVMSALMVIARQDPLRALEAATSLPSSHERDVAMSMTVEQWAAEDVRAALAWFDLQRDSRMRLATVASVAAAYAKSDWRSAADWHARLSPDERARTSPQIAIGMLEDDPPRAARLMLEQPNPEALSMFVMRWSELDPAACVAWIDANGDYAPSLVAMLPYAVASWAGSDRSAALAYLERMDPGPAFDEAASTAFYSLRDDPAAAKRLYDRIGSADIKKALADAFPE
jgi:hypothetical protein